MLPMGLRRFAGVVVGWAALAVPAVPVVGQSTPQTMIEARRLEQTIKNTLVERLGPDARTIEVALSGRRLFLSGTVEERVTQELAKEVVLTFPEVGSATNRIEARKALTLVEGQAFQEGQDAELELRLKRALAQVLGDAAKGLSVEVVDGVASLRGTVPDRDVKKQALDTTRTFTGVRDVLDLIRVVR